MKKLVLILNGMLVIVSSGLLYAEGESVQSSTIVQSPTLQEVIPAGTTDMSAVLMRLQATGQAVTPEQLKQFGQAAVTATPVTPVQSVEASTKPTKPARVKKARRYHKNKERQKTTKNTEANIQAPSSTTGQEVHAAPFSTGAIE